MISPLITQHLSLFFFVFEFSKDKKKSLKAQPNIDKPHLFSLWGTSVEATASGNPCSQSTLSQTAAILSNLFHFSCSMGILEHHMNRCNEPSHITKTKCSGAFVVQRVLFTEMPGKQEFVFLPLGASVLYIHKNALQNQARDLRGGHELCLATTDSLLKQREISLSRVCLVGAESC